MFLVESESFFLWILVFFPIITCFSLSFCFYWNKQFLGFIAIGMSLFCFLIFIFLGIFFDILYYNYQFIFFFNLNWFNFYINLGLDGLSFFFCLLICFLIPLCLLYNYSNINKFLREYFNLLLLLESLLLLVFLVLDLFWFFIFFESIVIPMFIIIGFWGSRKRKIHAAYMFLIYTLVGSIFMLSGILIIYSIGGTFDFQVLNLINISLNRQLLLWWLFFIGFAVKIPMIPLHIWLPEAHVESPTTGSVLLAGVLLKLGSYGMVRLLTGILYDALFFFLPIIFTFFLISLIYGACTTIRQIDLKKIIAYSSVVHMNFALLGLFSYSYQGVCGSIFTMFSHGIVSGALFFAVGLLYERYGSRNIFYFKGLAQFMPIFSVMFLILVLTNMGFPGTISFIGEFLILVGIFQENIFIGILAGIGLIFGAIYMIWLYNRVCFGFVSNNMFLFKDLTLRELYVLLPFIFIIFVYGIYPLSFFKIIDLFIFKILI